MVGRAALALAATLALVSAGAETASAEGIDGSRIRVESNARHTGENADFVMPILRKERIGRATIVTDSFHVPRARFHFRSARREQGYRVELRTFAVADGLAGKDRLRRAVSERNKIRRDSKWRASRNHKARLRAGKFRTKLRNIKARGR